MLVHADVRPVLAPRPHTRHRAFFPAMSALLIVLVFIGFAPTYYLRPQTAGPIPIFLHVHGVAMSAWFLLLLVQTTLIATRRRAVHRRLGIAGAVIAAVITVLNPLVVAWSVPPGIAAGAPIDSMALIVVGDLLLMAIFAVLVTGAIVWRRHPETHSRMLMLASIAASGPALGRFSLLMTNTPLPGIIVLMGLPLTVIAHDWVRTKRVHRGSAWAATAIAASLIAAVAVASSPAAGAVVGWFD